MQLFFDGKPSDEIRDALKKEGFRWSPRFGAWQRQLTPNAYRAVKYAFRNLGITIHETADGDAADLTPEQAEPTAEEPTETAETITEDIDAPSEETTAAPEIAASSDETPEQTAPEPTTADPDPANVIPFPAPTETTAAPEATPADATQESAPTPEDVTAALIAEITAAAAMIPGCTAEVKGAKTARPIIWLHGVTKDHKDAAKSIGALWSAKKSAWWITPDRFTARREIPAD